MKNATFRAPASLVTRRVGTETMLLEGTTGRYFTLDDLATRVWQLLATGETPARVCDVLAPEFDVERSALERDVMDLVADLERRGLLEPVGG
jgi:hypothetical protein